MDSFKLILLEALIAIQREFKLRREPLFLSFSLLESVNEPISIGALLLVLLGKNSIQLQL